MSAGCFDSAFLTVLVELLLAEFAALSKISQHFWRWYSVGPKVGQVTIKMSDKVLAIKKYSFLGRMHYKMSRWRE